MYVKELDKDTMFVKVISTDNNNNKHIYFVDEKIENGLRTIVATKDPTKARLFSLQEAYIIVYNGLDEDEKQEIVHAHQSNDGYGGLTKRLNEQFKVITTERINYGYQDDCKHEAKLLEQLDLSYMYKGVQTIVKDVDANE